MHLPSLFTALLAVNLAACEKTGPATPAGEVPALRTAAVDTPPSEEFGLRAPSTASGELRLSAMPGGDENPPRHN